MAKVTMLRGVSVLPDEQGGRTALLWLLAGGVPREAAMTALVAPTESLEPHDTWAASFRLEALRNTKLLNHST